MHAAVNVKCQSIGSPRCELVVARNPFTCAGLVKSIPILYDDARLICPKTGKRRRIIRSFPIMPWHGYEKMCGYEH